MKALHIKKEEREYIKTSELIEVSILISGDKTNNNISLFESRVQPGGSPPRHIHEKHDETFFINEGEFIIEIDNKIMEVKTGDVAFVPRGSVHSFKNIGDTVGTLQYLFTPYSDMETFFKKVSRLSMPNDKKELEALLIKHDNIIKGSSM
ncbi:cupin domain-containing protein [Tenacibaculum aiptasiae]|uniref:cupin domain-containing protein n=1 Tax=Tenacibaculum aiptasiae TaxID=426481 RepID=UPI00232EECFE|nr:cupin domain-containing protein [Tenacibaculum aiptasiae]